MRKNILVGLLLLLGLIGLSGLAGASDRDGYHDLSVSAGIANPSYSTATFQNPAGIKNTPGIQLNGEGGWNSTFKDPTYRAGLLYGGKTFGFAGGMSTSPSGSGTSSAYFGVAAEIPQLKTVIGASGFTGLSPAGGTIYNAGVLFSPQDQYHFGFTAMSVNNGIQEWGGESALRRIGIFP